MLLASVPRGLFFEIATPDLFQPVREVPEFTTNPKVRAMLVATLRYVIQLQSQTPEMPRHSQLIVGLLQQLRFFFGVSCRHETLQHFQQA